MSKDSGEKKSGDDHQSKKGKGIVMYQRKKYSHNKKATALPSKQHAPPPEITVTDCLAGFVPPPQPVPDHFRANKVSKAKVYPSVVIPPSSNEPQKTRRGNPAAEDGGYLVHRIISLRLSTVTARHFLHGHATKWQKGVNEAYSGTCIDQGIRAVGSTLTATDSTKPWLSPSGDFAFGFSQIEGKNQFLLCIWYANINERTIVWHANTTSPVPQGSTLRLDADSGLILSDPQGNKLWTPDVFEVVDHGFLNDTGKFFLVGSDSKVLWDTFAHPTDTLLPTQEMDIGTMLVSRRSEANFSLGRFYLRMLDGNLVLSSKMVPTNLDYDADYYNSQTSDPSNLTNSGYKVIFSEKGSISILKRNNATQELTPRSVASVLENYLRLTLNFDGVLTLYRYPKGSGGYLSRIPLWSQPDNICRQLMGEKGSGACGYNSVCSIGSNQRPYCNCPQGYSLLDHSDQYGSCQPNYVQTCGKPANGSSGELFSIIEITDRLAAIGL
nr:G-type lectin S-receptor-like serine/threonine-protein kinase RLK1 [Ipomoea batatas]